MAQGDFGAGVLLLQTALEIWPEYVDAWIDLCKAHLALGETAEAITAGEKAAELSSHTAILALKALGEAQLAARDYSAAAEALETAVMISPHDWEVAYRLAIAKQELGEPREAIACLERAITLRPAAKAMALQEPALGALRKEIDAIPSP